MTGHSIHGFPLTANISTLFRELPFLDRIPAARDAGFDAVECWWHFESASPPDSEVDAFLDALTASDISLAAHNFNAGDMAAGERGILSIPGAELQFAASVEVLVEIGKRTGCRIFNALYGVALPGVAPDIQLSFALANLELATSALEGIVVLEPLTAGANGSYPLLTAADALAVIDRAPGVRLLLDTFHLTNNGDDLGQVLVEHGEQVGHVQIADAPERTQPGTGSIDFVSFFRDLAASAFRGAVAVEYVPLIATSDSFGWISRLQEELA